MDVRQKQSAAHQRNNHGGGLCCLFHQYFGSPTTFVKTSGPLSALPIGIVPHDVDTCSFSQRDCKVLPPFEIQKSWEQLCPSDALQCTNGLHLRLQMPMRLTLLLRDAATTCSPSISLAPLLASLRVRQDDKNQVAAGRSLPPQRQVTKQITKWLLHEHMMRNPPTERMRDVHMLHHTNRRT